MATTSLGIADMLRGSLESMKINDYLKNWDAQESIKKYWNSRRTAPAGSLPGATAGVGSREFGDIPYAPDPAATSAAAIGTNLTNLPALQALLSGIANAYIPGATDKFAQEASNIDELLNPGSLVTGMVPGLTDVNRMSGEAATMRGISGSPAGIAAGYRRSDDEVLKRKLLGSQLLSGAAQRGAGMFNIPSFFVSPEFQYSAQDYANRLAAAPNPGAQYNLVGANAALAQQAGMRSGYGGGGGGQIVSPSMPSFQAPASNQSGSNAGQITNRYMGALGLQQPPAQTASPQPYLETGGDSVFEDRINDAYLRGSGVYPGTTYNLDPGQTYDWAV